jgi:hypothetical protein
MIWSDLRKTIKSQKWLENPLNWALTASIQQAADAGKY